MSTSISDAEARLQFVEILGHVVAAGNDYIITQKGKPVARLVPIEASPAEAASTDEAGLEENDPFFAALEQVRQWGNSQSLFVTPNRL